MAHLVDKTLVITLQIRVQSLPGPPQQIILRVLQIEIPAAIADQHQTLETKVSEFWLKKPGGLVFSASAVQRLFVGSIMENGARDARSKF